MNINQTGHIPGIDAAQMPWKGGFMNVAFRIGVCDVTVTQFIIGVCSVTQQQFRDLMSELLVDGITKERIIVLFFFCADVVISILKYVTETDSVDLCKQFLNWSKSFITERICSWVQENGGWIGVCSVTQQQFRDLMSELLVDGITKERIIVLFFFCADVAISILKYVTETDSVDLCNQFLRWSISFITERICSWVQENGGWGAIFNSSLRYLRNIAIVGFFGLAVYFGVRKFARQPIS